MMTKLFYTIFSITFFNCLAIAQFTDDFSDGNFSSNPTWFGESSKFEAASNELHLNDTAAGTAFMVTNSNVIHTAIWEFRVKMDHSPSSSNLSRVFLMSDNSDLTASLNGYYVEIGNNSSSTSDDITLYRLDGSNKTKLIDGADGILNTSSVDVMIKVERDASGNWTLYSDTSGSGSTSYILEGTASDNIYNTSNYFGVFCEYTSSRADNYYFDDFSVSGTTYQDTIAPVLNTVTVISQDTLELKFSENIKKSTGENTANYSVDNSVGNPATALFDASDSSVIRLAFGTPKFPNGTICSLSVTGIMDNKNNVISSTQKPFIYFIVVPASFHDLVINEIFADPSPQIGLPAFEFIEIHNTSTNVYDLNDWSLTVGSTSKNIESFILVPGAYLILCHEDDTFSYKFYGDVIGLSSFSLTNTSGDLYLNDNNGTLIDEVHYEDSWYNDNDKSDGGYSLELINPGHPCQSATNWTASENTNGGTPGSENSVYDITADTEGASISKINIISNNEIEVILSETMDSLTVANGSYSANNGLSVLFPPTPSGPYFNTVNLTFTTAFQSGTIYTLTVNGVKDCSGNLIGSNNTAEFIFPDTASSSDMIINEVMVNPVGTGTDYVELYNNSTKYIDLKNWSIATFNDDLNAVSSEKIISESTSIVYPGEYVLISKDNQNILEQYPYTNDSNFIEIESLPTYSNESGSVIILDDKDTVIDRFDYHEDLHFVLLDSYDGVALERLDFDRTTQDATNWTSAAETVGFGTPGYKNSQTLVANFTGDKVNVDPEIFSPDNDGYKDILNINYEFETEGTVANISIYDAKGNLVRQLVKNELLGKSGSYSWDGTNEINEKAKVGIHIIYFEIFDVNGNVESHKKTCVVASRL